MISLRINRGKIMLLVMSLFLLMMCSEKSDNEELPSNEMLALSQLITINNLKVSDSVKIILSHKTLQEYSITPSQMSTYLSKNPKDAPFWMDISVKLKELINRSQEKQVFKKSSADTSRKGRIAID